MQYYNYFKYKKNFFTFAKNNLVIQRFQTLFLILVSLNSSLGLLFYNEFFFKIDKWKIIDIILIVFLVLSFFGIFLFKIRKQQIGINYFNLLLNILLIGFLVFILLNLSGGFVPEKGIGIFIPIINIVLLFMANFYIKKDEKLVKSVDRFR